MTGIPEAPAYAVGVGIMTAIAGWLFFMDGNYALAWSIYPIGGGLVLALMIFGKHNKSA